MAPRKLHRPASQGRGYGDGESIGDDKALVEPRVQSPEVRVEVGLVRSQIFRAIGIHHDQPDLPGAGEDVECQFGRIRMNGHVGGAADNALGERICEKLANDALGVIAIAALGLGGEDIPVQPGDQSAADRVGFDVFHEPTADWVLGDVNVIVEEGGQHDSLCLAHVRRGSQAWRQFAPFADEHDSPCKISVNHAIAQELHSAIGARIKDRSSNDLVGHGKFGSASLK